MDNYNEGFASCGDTKSCYIRIFCCLSTGAEKIIYKFVTYGWEEMGGWGGPTPNQNLY